MALVPPFFPPLCPYPTCAHNGHIRPIGRPEQYWSPRYRARWRHKTRPCCEWCDTFKEYAPGLYHEIKSPFPLHPVLEDIREDFQDIHHYYKRETTGSVFDYSISFRVEWLSQYLWDLYKLDLDDFLGFEFQKLAEQLRDMALELQIGPPRELYHTMPRPKLLV